MNQPFENDDLRIHEKFSKLFTKKLLLGEGGDGIVYAYEHKSSKALVAVKTPLQSASEHDTMCATERIEAEIKNLTLVGRHKHIAGLLTWSSTPVAIFLPLCELGDLMDYVVRWKEEQRRQGKLINRVSEVTIWKCLHDMALALDYLHNKYKHYGFTHNDVKPDNILVDLPNDWKLENGIPDEPIFRLTDFARMTEYNPTESEKTNDFRGTPEYAPPFAERGGLRPPADIWALGATLQTLALGICPTQSIEAFSASRIKDELPVRILIDEIAWNQDHCRDLIPPTFRPLSATKEKLINDFDVQNSIVIDQFYPRGPWEHKPYSKELDGWYEWMFEVNEKRRITARMLVRHCVPGIARKILVAREQEKAHECFERAKALRKEVERKQQGSVREAEGVAFEMVSIPADKGNYYHAIEAV